MDSQAERCEESPQRRPMVGYEPPRVERVLGPSDLEREILYAGPPGTLR